MRIIDKECKYLGIKFFEKQDHMEKFANGLIYFSTTGSLNIGNNTETNYNEYEIPLYNMPITINDEEFNCKSYTLYYDWQKMVPIFCYYRLDNSNLYNGKDIVRIKLPERLYNQGNKKYAAIFPLSDFLNRLEEACNNKYGYKHVDIKYIDYSKQDNSWINIVKSNKYGFLEVHDIRHRYQNESRVILTDLFVKKPILINIGKWRLYPILLQYLNNEWQWV